MRLGKEGVKTAVKRVFRRRLHDPLGPTPRLFGNAWIRIVWGCLGVTLVLWGVGYAVTDSIHKRADEERRRQFDWRGTIHMEVSFDGERFQIANLQNEELQNLCAFLALYRYPGSTDGSSNLIDTYTRKIQRIGIDESYTVRASDFTNLSGESLSITADTQIPAMLLQEYASSWPEQSLGNWWRSGFTNDLKRILPPST